MGTTYYDSEGQTTFLNGVPINAVKKATFKDKLGTLHTLLKMVYNSVTYDFTKTAQGGAVIFADNYSTWEFIAPDDRLDFEGYTNMTLEEALDAMKATLNNNPVPAWEQFIVWLDKKRYTINSATSYYAVYLKNYSETISLQVNAFQLPEMNNFSDFLDALGDACAPALEYDMADFKTSDTSFVCKLSIVNPSNNATAASMTFKFRE